MTQAGSAGMPPMVEVMLTNSRTGESRIFQQAELTIDGEVRLFTLVQDIGKRLAMSDFPWAKLGKLFEADASEVDWPLAEEILQRIVELGPDMIVDSACILFDIQAILDDGTRNPDWDKERAFVRKAINFTRWVGLIQTFVEQNDYKRLAAPFSRALAAGASLGRPPANEGLSEL